VPARPKPPFLASVGLAPGTPRRGYPFELPAVRGVSQIAFAPITVLVGDNGTGKSTLVEAIAAAAGFNPEGGGRNLRFETHSTHSRLHEHLQLNWTDRPHWGWFLRAETFYGMATHIVTDGPQYGVTALFSNLHAESHGESFLDLALSRFLGPGLYVLDEPEAALSLQGQLKMLRIIHDSVAAGGQFLLATHSPILMAHPESLIYELDGDKPRRCSWDEVGVVHLWRRFLVDPSSMLRHLLAADDDDRASPLTS